MCLLTLFCFLGSLHPLHIKLHSLPSNINFMSLLSELHLVVALPSYRHLLAFVPGACPGLYSPSYILIKDFICWRSASAQTVKPVYGLLVQCTSWYPYLESRIYEVSIT